RRHRVAHELRRQAARRSFLRCGLRRTQPPQGGAVRPSHHVVLRDEHPRRQCAAIDFPTDTTRTLASLAYSGTFARCPDIKFIFSHGGGTMPMIVQRVAAAIRNFTPDERARILPNVLEAELKRHHYDIASVAMNPAGMAAVFKLVPVSR